jgi:hypothetical protein
MPTMSLRSSLAVPFATLLCMLGGCVAEEAASECDGAACLGTAPEEIKPCTKRRPCVDGGASDSGTTDAGTTDAGATDAGTTDGRASDASSGCPASKRIISAGDVSLMVNSGYPAGTALFVPDGPDPWGGCFPGPKTTGIPSGATLSAYSGTCDVRTDGTVIDGKLITGCYTLKINANDVTIKNSKFVGSNLEVQSGSLTITDSEADFGPDRDGQGFTGSHIVAKRLNLYGGHRQMWCADCVVEDSYFHDQNISQDPQAHASAMRAESGTTYRHNTVLCNAAATAEGGGCSADQTGYPDFGPIHHNTIDKNFFLAPTDAGYCAYGGWNPGKPYNDDPQNATYVRFTDNVMQRGTNANDIKDYQFPKTSRHRYTCAFWGPTTSYRPDRTGSVFTGNMWDDGLRWEDDRESPYWPFHE